MIAAVTQRIEREPIQGEIRDALSHEWYGFLHAAGFEVVLPIPNIGRSSSEWIRNVKPDVIVLSGGNDVQYGQDVRADSNPLSELRDETEKTILDLACKERIPTFGVCRGMQFIHAYFGGQLVQQDGHISRYHTIKYCFPDLHGQEWHTTDVNSFHLYGVTTDLPHGLLPIAYHMEDRSVEAFIHCDHPIMGIMWHPERNQPYSDRDISWLKRLMEKVDKGHVG